MTESLLPAHWNTAAIWLISLSSIAGILIRPKRSAGSLVGSGRRLSPVVNWRAGKGNDWAERHAVRASGVLELGSLLRSINFRLLLSRDACHGQKQTEQLAIDFFRGLNRSCHSVTIVS